MTNSLILKELSLEMGKDEFDMFQEIPAKENGSTNLCHGIPFENFKAYLENQMARKHQKLSPFDTPTIMYVLYDQQTPIGYVGIRTKLNPQWKKWSGNIFYTIRPSKRHLGYGTKALKLAVEECKKLNINPIYIQANKDNVFSQRIIEKNGGKLYSSGETKYYTI